MEKEYTLLDDPLYYITLAFFALLTTGLAAGLGQPRFLPISQTIALFVFLIMAFRQRSVRAALWALAIWLVIQMITVIVITWFLPNQVEHAISQGFEFRTGLAGWLHANQPLPDSLLIRPLGRLLEVAGVLVGSVISGGLVGLWFLMHAANQTAFGAGTLGESSGVGALVAGLSPWSLLRIAGYAGFIVLLAEPLFSSNWSPRYYLTQRRRLLIGSAAMLILGLLLELVLPGLWRTLFT